MNHGIATTYTKLGCRCAPCTEAERVRAAMNRGRRYGACQFVDGRWIHPDAPHDTVGGYRNWGCRCEGCSAAHAAKVKEYRKSKKVAS